VLGLVAVASAGKYSEKTLIGTWEFDMLKMMKDQMGGQVPEGMDLEQMLAGSFVRITFVKDGTYSFSSKTPMGEESDGGKWEIVSINDNEFVVKSTGSSGEEQVITMVFTNKDSFDASMPGPNKQTVTMTANRMKEGEEKAATKETKQEEKGEKGE